MSDTINDPIGTHAERISALTLALSYHLDPVTRAQREAEALAPFAEVRRTSSPLRLRKPRRSAPSWRS